MKILSEVFIQNFLDSSFILDESPLDSNDSIIYGDLNYDRIVRLSLSV